MKEFDVAHLDGVAIPHETAQREDDGKVTDNTDDGVIRLGGDWKSMPIEVCWDQLHCEREMNVLAAFNRDFVQLIFFFFSLTSQLSRSFFLPQGYNQLFCSSAYNYSF